MRTEAVVFAGVAAFFLATDVLYAVWSREPAGTAALTVSFLMALLVCLFFARNHRVNGLRPEDRKDGEVRERSGPLDFFPPHSAWPVLTAVGAGVLALGVIYGLWLALIGLGALAAGVAGLVFQYAGEETG
ncbi:cytochrome c oxidase subunit 4 [Streptomyces sp. CC208A]|uniref:aa3-type cytochrome oxidase subunit IV n=1 Tax=Streptomyces sp. CC208A TaxID=3044573 RepID=UPI0024A83F2E|nr:cytochrome c oxidase subunit 4 [Streptomyces sp. CC208A]